MQRKADIGIGYRAYLEADRLFPKPKHARIALGCNRKTMYSWRDGAAPCPTYLARLCELGADVEWILTGKRRKQQ